MKAPDTNQKPTNFLLSTAQSQCHRPAYIPHTAAVQASDAANQTDQPIRNKAQRHSITTEEVREEMIKTDLKADLFLRNHLCNKQSV